MPTTIPPLFEHQKEDIASELSRDITFDTSDAGTGKTRTRLEVFSKRRAAGARCALVLAPKSLLRTAWEADNRKYTPWLKTSVAYAATRAEDFERKADIYITNHDAVTWLAKQNKKFFDRFDVLIIDESTAFKHHTSQRSKALNKIKRFFKYRTVMSGTPNTNSITDVWNQVNVLDDGRRLGSSYFHFRGTVQEPEQVGPRPNMVKWTDREGAELAVGSLLSDIVIRHKLEECHTIPPNHNYIIPYELPPKVQAAYDKMEADAVLQLKTGKITAINAAALVTKLLQICSGAVYDSDGSYHVIDTDRYTLVAQLVQERKHSIVFFNWQHQRDLLIEEFKKNGITYAVIDGQTSDNARVQIVNDFQAGFYRVLLAHPKSAAHGLTLIKATSTIWASPTYNLEFWLQGNRRIYRAGQTQRTETVNIIADRTREERVYRILTGKDTKHLNFLEVLS